MASKEYNPLPPKLLTRFEEILKRCEIQKDPKHPQERSRLDTIRGDFDKLKSDMKDRPKLTVAVYGDTGSGKSTLLNAILDQPNLVPTSCTSACTSLAVKIEENIDGSEFEAEVGFLSVEEWEREREVLIGDLMDTDTGKGKINSAASKSAEAMMTAVYGEFNDKNLGEIKKTENKVTAKLGEKIVIKKNEAKSLQDELVTYIEARKNKGSQFWPIVKHMILRIPKSDLSTRDIVFIDLPGVGDSNPARDKMAEKYWHTSDVLLVVADIKRAVDSKTAGEVVEERMLRKAKMDGLETVRVCTHADIVDVEGVLRRINIPEAAKLDEETNKLKEKERELKKLKAKKEKIQEVREERKKLAKQKKTRCALARNNYVKDEMKKKKAALQVFCVSSTNYHTLHLSDSSDLDDYDNETPIFSTVDETEIPGLRNFLKRASQKKKEEKQKTNISDLKSVVSGLLNYLTTIELGCITLRESLKVYLTNKLDTVLSETMTDVGEMGKAIVNMLQVLFQTLEVGVETAIDEAPSICESWSSPLSRDLPYNTYKATVRRYGKYSSRHTGMKINFNMDLCDPLEKCIESAWTTAFSEEEKKKIIQEKVTDSFSKRVTSITKAVLESVKKATAANEEALSQLLTDIEKDVNEKLLNRLNEILRLVQDRRRTINGNLAVIIKENMMDIYERCTKISGVDAYKIIKWKMFKGINQKKSSISEAVKEDVWKSVNDMKSEVVSILDNIVQVICKDHREQIEVFWKEQKIAVSSQDLQQCRLLLHSLLQDIEKLDQNKGIKRKREDDDEEQ